MTRDDVIKLVNAGFTKEEILGLGAPEKTPEETPAEASVEAPLFSEEGLNTMTEGISKAIIEQLQKNNIMNSNMPEVPEVSGEDIIATVLDLIDE